MTINEHYITMSGSVSCVLTFACRIILSSEYLRLAVFVKQQSCAL